MPEIHFLVRWPDGSVQRCYSPSTVVADYLVAGQDYASTEFVDRVTEALTVADERVRAKYGFGCGRAVALSAELRARAAMLAGDARVLVEGFER